MRTFAIASLGAAMATTAQAATGGLSDRIAEAGLGPVIAELEALPDPGPADRFALGGLLFLGAIERALQLRYTYGMTDDIAMMIGVPILRLPIPENPDPEPFDPAVIEALFAAAEADFARAIQVLDMIGDDDDFGLKIDTGDLWFDIDGNGTRGPGEGLGAALDALMPFGTQATDISVRFDTADAKWLSAYAHMLSGIAEGVLALHPTDRLAAVLADIQALNAYGRPQDDPYNLSDLFDTLAILVAILETRPDPDKSRAAHAHFLAMIRDNRSFWARAQAETDNAAEWIPNARQQSALPLSFPPETAMLWGEVLTEAEEVLQGRRMVPLLRLGPGVGINLARFLQDPPELDVMGMIQGRTFLPYLEQGPVMEGAALRRFEAMMAGDAGLFMVVLN